MSDLRQGVTEAGHAVLDMVDRLREPNLSHVELNLQAMEVLGLVAGNLSARRLAALTAAALLILVAEEIDRELAS